VEVNDDVADRIQDGLTRYKKTQGNWVVETGGRMPRIEVAGDICCRRPRHTQVCRADDDDDDDDNVAVSVRNNAYKNTVTVTPRSRPHLHKSVFPQILSTSPTRFVTRKVKYLAGPILRHTNPVDTLPY
jgi:hypothetical protein